MIKLLLAAATCIGRIDRPFLAKGIGRVGPLELDNYPIVHTKDLLSHEAHRHPYIELLGVFYMMKLRYGEHFGARAGSAWRLLFVYALFPWLHQYRIGARPELIKSKSDAVSDAVRRQSSAKIDFISLKNIADFQKLLEEEGEDEDAGDGFQAMDSEPCSLPQSSEPWLGRGNRDLLDIRQVAEDQAEMIRQLEMENARLRSVLEAEDTRAEI